MKLPLFPLISRLARRTAIVSAALALVTPAFAGMLTVTSGPTFTPSTDFSNNRITVQTIHTSTGDLVRESGTATITPPAAGPATIQISFSGNFSANAGDLGSVAYDFTVDSNDSRSFPYEVRGSVTIAGNTQNFSSSGTITNGVHQYTNQAVASAPFPAGVSGTFTGLFTITVPVILPIRSAVSSAAPGTLDISITQGDFQLSPTAAGLASPSQILNISTRLPVGTGENALIGGFIVTGSDPKQVIIRGIGPSLTGVDGTLADPTLELHQGNTTLLTNDNWKINDQNGQSQEADIQATTIPPANDMESAILTTLSPGAYTAILAGKNATTGVGLVEVYDLGQAAHSQLANISTRGFVDTGDNIMIGGLIVGGASGGTSKVIVRALGPSLAGSGIQGVLADPTLELHDGNGVTLATNDNWKTASDGTSQQGEIEGTGIPPKNDLESALISILNPGNYTAVVRGTNNGTGVALVEVYNLAPMGAD